jgi:hypothetical protein
METQNATIHLSPPMLTTRPFALRHRAEPVKKKNRESDLPHSQPTSQYSKIDIENGRGRWRHSRSNKGKKMETPGPDKRKLRSTSDRESLTTQTRNC